MPLDRLWIGLCGLLIACALLAPASLPAASREPAATVVALRGKATATAPNGGPRLLALKAPVFQDDTIATGPRGRLQLLFTDNTVISLGRNARLQVNAYQWQPDRREGGLTTTVEEGAFRVMGGAITRVAPRKFLTKTPTATIGIRGSMYAGMATATSLKVVFQGGRGIKVFNPLGSVTITRPGYGTRVFRGKPPAPPVQFTAKDLSELDKELAGGEEQEDRSKDNGEETGQQGQSGEEDQGQGDQSQTGGSNEQPASADSAPTPGDDTGTVLTAAGQETTTFTPPVIPADDTPASPQESLTTDTVRDLTGKFLVSIFIPDLAGGSHDREGGAVTASQFNESIGILNADGSKLSFDIPGYNPAAAYDGASSFTAPFTMPSAFGTFDTNMTIHASPLGEFLYGTIRNTVTLGGTDYAFRFLSFIGAGATSLPTTGINTYSGQLLHAGLDADNIFNSDLEKLNLSINWANQTMMGRVTDAYPDPAAPDHDVFFFGTLSGSRFSSVQIVSFGGGSTQTSTDPGINVTVGSTSFGQLYGSVYQGLGFVASGQDISVYSQQARESWEAAGAAFRDPAAAVSSAAGSAVRFEGFVVGIGEDMDAPATSRRRFFTSSASPLEFTVNKDTGVITGSGSQLSATDLASAQTINHIQIGGSGRSAYVANDRMIALLTCPGNDCIAGDTTAGLKTYGNLMVTAPAAEQSQVTGAANSPYLTWGYWEAAYTDPDTSKEYHVHIPGSLWIAGEQRTPASRVSGLLGNPAAFTGNYQGGAKGVYIDTNGLVRKLANGVTNLNVDFYSGTVNGSLSFDQATLNLATGTVSASTPGFSAGFVGGSGTNLLQGTFYGPDVNAIAGNFDTTIGSTTYTGIFGGTLTNGPAP